MDEVVEEALRGLDDNPHRDAWELLAARFVGPAKVAEALRCLVEAGATPDDLRRDPFDQESAAGFSAELESALAEFFDVEDGLLVEAARNRMSRRQTRSGAGR